MKSLGFGRCALSAGIAAALLAGCSGSSIPIRATDNAATDASTLKNSKTFDYTGKKQTFVVPAGVTQLSVIARGGEGDGGGPSPSSPPALAGRVYAVIPVQPGDKLYVYVGGAGAHGGFNGGAPGGTNGYGWDGYRGGGASDVRSGADTLKDRIIVAAGAGGGGGTDGYVQDFGGDGGGVAGRPGSCIGSYNVDEGGGGGGGRQRKGGSGGAGGLGYQSGGNGDPGSNGALGSGGTGGNAQYVSPYWYAGAGGGGGGGGYYG
ncbi:MAG: hypothetical protein WCB01_10010, partial [Candidatus Cybelea sp.]